MENKIEGTKNYSAGFSTILSSNVYYFEDHRDKYHPYVEDFVLLFHNITTY